ncbi:hypothetical protein SAMN05428989_0424 [Pseudoxanthomonas sp. GM95]|nr:hypothetical protein SAMN05428989_0424 [Pseudoxanthomonas sp. GM95]
MLGLHRATGVAGASSCTLALLANASCRLLLQARTPPTRRRSPARRTGRLHATLKAASSCDQAEQSVLATVPVRPRAQESAWNRHRAAGLDGRHGDPCCPGVLRRMRSTSCLAHCGWRRRRVASRFHQPMNIAIEGVFKSNNARRVKHGSWPCLSGRRFQISKMGLRLQSSLRSCSSTRGAITPCRMFLSANGIADGAGSCAHETPHGACVWTTRCT